MIQRAAKPEQENRPQKNNGGPDDPERPAQPNPLLTLSVVVLHLLA
jgi:hypothetical protein